MVNYQNGKIYKIVLDNCDEVYVGSTTKRLCERMAVHRADAKRRPLPFHNFVSEYGWDKAHIVLIEDYPCDRKEQLYARERYWIEQISTMNIMIPAKTIEERREEKSKYAHEWYLKNKESVDEKRRQYRKDNADKLRQKDREYHEANKERINERKRAYMKVYNKKKKQDIIV